VGVDVVGVGVTVGVTVTLELAVTVTVTVGLGLAVPVGLPVAVAVLLVLAALELAEVGELLVAATEAELVCAALDELAVAGAHEEGAVAAVCPPDVAPTDVPPPNPVPPPPVLVEPAEALGAPSSPTDWNIGWRIDGTAASITPTANTAKPTAKAGRSMASRQSRGRCACRGLVGLARWAPGVVCPWRSTCQPRARPAFQRHSRSASTLRAAAMLRVSRNLPALA
jgi:hypothetical protein